MDRSSPPANDFSFWIAPVTLIFRDVINLNTDINHEPPNIFDFEIMNIHRLEEFTYPNGDTILEMADRTKQW
jgi:hypothetical protein